MKGGNNRFSLLIWKLSHLEDSVCDILFYYWGNGQSALQSTCHSGHDSSQRVLILISKPNTHFPIPCPGARPNVYIPSN